MGIQTYKDKQALQALPKFSEILKDHHPVNEQVSNYRNEQLEGPEHFTEACFTNKETEAQKQTDQQAGDGTTGSRT